MLLDTKKATPKGRLFWAQQDLNLRLPPCEGGTLPLSYAPAEVGNMADPLRLSSPSVVSRRSLENPEVFGGRQGGAQSSLWPR